MKAGSLNRGRFGLRDAGSETVVADFGDRPLGLGEGLTSMTAFRRRPRGRFVGESRPTIAGAGSVLAEEMVGLTGEEALLCESLT